MPYGGEKNAAQVAKIERCVNDLMKKGKSKSSAIAICKASILKKEDLPIQMTMNILEGGINEEKRTVEACVLSPCLSGNKRYYSPTIVESASNQLVGLKSFADHYDHTIKNTIAKIVGAKYEDGRAIATFKFSKAKDIAESVFTRIKEGIITDVSIAASGNVRRVKMNNEWVDEVRELKIQSVDFVTEGGVEDAKVLRVFESNELPDIREVNTMTLEELRDTQPELIAEIEKPLEELRKQNEELTKKVQEFEAKAKEQEIKNLREKMVGELQETDEVKSLVREKISGDTEEEIKQSIDGTLDFIKKIAETKKEVKVPEVKVKEKKKYKTQEEVWADQSLSLAEKAELINRLWWG